MLTHSDRGATIVPRRALNAPLQSLAGRLDFDPKPPFPWQLGCQLTLSAEAAAILAADVSGYSRMMESTKPARLRA